MSELVLYEVEGAVATVTMHRPQYRNAQNAAMTQALDAALMRAASDDAIKVIVLMSDGDDDAVRWAVRDLSRIGFDRMLGWVDASEALHAWREAGHTLQTVPQLSVTDVASTRADGAATVVDVRGRTEWDSGHLDGAMHIPLGDLRQRWHELPTTPLLVHCQSGAR